MKREKKEWKIIKSEKCPKGHKVKWIGFVKTDFDGKLLSGSPSFLPPHALLFCSKCGYSYSQKPAYQGVDGKLRVQLSDKPNP